MSELMVDLSAFEHVPTPTVLPEDSEVEITLKKIVSKIGKNSRRPYLSFIWTVTQDEDDIFIDDIFSMLLMPSRDMNSDHLRMLRENWKQQLDALGLELPDDWQVDLEEALNTQCQVILGVEEYRGKERNVIKCFL